MTVADLTLLAERAPLAQPKRTLVLACGALVNELQQIRETNHLDHLDIECLPAKLHLRPHQIPIELRKRLDRSINSYDEIVIGYGDCGTAGAIDDLCKEYGVRRIPGAHCYQFFATAPVFDELHDSDPTIFWLTDFLARHFDLFVMSALGIDAHPELREMYFGNYTRLIYLAQTHDADLDHAAEAAAEKLGLRYERRYTGYGELADELTNASTPVMIPSAMGAAS